MFRTRSSTGCIVFLQLTDLKEAVIYEPTANRMKTTFVCLLFGLALALLPESTQATLRDYVRLAFRPGQELTTDAVASSTSVWQSTFESDSQQARDEVASLQKDLANSRLQTQQFRLAARHWKQRVHSQTQHGSSPFESSNSHPLIVAQAIEARIIGEHAVSLWKANKLLNAGGKNGIEEDQWVLDNADLKLDQGQATGVLSGLPVFAGRCIVGRIAASGRWTSSLELISARSFRAKAIIGETQTDSVSSSTNSSSSRLPEFLIEGNGSGLCILTQVPITAAVEIGSPVYSVPGDRAVNGSMLFGFIESADRQRGSLHWDIVVRPAAQLAQLETVQIVTASLNPDRIVGQR